MMLMHKSTEDRQNFSGKVLGRIAIGAVSLFALHAAASFAASGPAADLIQVAGKAGRAIGAASSCNKVSSQRLKLTTENLAAAIRDYSKKRQDAHEEPSADIAAAQDAYAQGVTAGHAAGDNKLVDCATVERDLADADRSITQVAEGAPTLNIAPPAVTTVAAKAPVEDVNTPKFVPLSAAPTATAASAPPVAPSMATNVVGELAVVRGVSDKEIRLGMVAPFTGAARELGRQMKLGIETAFNAVNEAGGINGRKLTLFTADDGYDPARTAEAMKELDEKQHVLGYVGNVGTPTSAVALPYALTHRMMFYGAFTGAPLLRRDPPDRYVFNFRASYAEETASTVQYIVKNRRLKPEQIAVFAQQDGYGDAGFEGVVKAMRAMSPTGEAPQILRVGYPRNTVDVDGAIAQLQTAMQNPRRGAAPIKAIVMVATYRAAAKFIEKTHDSIPGLVYSNVSFVGSSSLADELLVLGPKYASGVIVTQVVPNVDGYASVVLDYKSALAKYFPGEKPDFVSLEGFLEAKVLIEGLTKAGPQVDTEKAVSAMENLKDVDLGLGSTVSFSRSSHQGLHKVWGTEMDGNGHFNDLDLD
jgi:ABC-type branched-subunit amino acid transport system substrate-binding protein